MRTPPVDQEMKVAVIDLGFNSLKMVVYQVDDQGSFRAYRQDAFKARLGEGLDETGLLSDAPMRRTIEYLTILKEIAQLEGVDRIIPVATSAVREAQNSERFLRDVARETRFAFRVLSSDEEALLSFTGALGFAPAPDVVFFDLGGGSLEMVRAADYTVKKVMSLPLGALRLTLDYVNKDGEYTKSSLARMKNRIRRRLPQVSEINTGGRTRLVGVGGTVRALARYHQEVVGYPIPKIQGYRIPYDSINAICRSFLKMSQEELARENAVGNRAESMAAGALVVKTLMKTFEFDELTVSARGLREGTLSMYLRDRRSFYGEGARREDVSRFVRSSAHELVSSRQRNWLALEQAHLLSTREVTMLSEAHRLAALAPSSINLGSLFSSVVEEDSPLTHEDQLLAGLVIVNAKNERAARELQMEFRGFLSRTDRRSLKRLSAIFSLTETLERLGAKMRVTRRGRDVSIRLDGGRRPLPTILLMHQAEEFAELLDLSVKMQTLPHRVVTAQRQEARTQ